MRNHNYNHKNTKIQIAFKEQYKKYESDNFPDISDEEKEHLKSFYSIGLKHADDKSAYLSELNQTVQDWIKKELYSSDVDINSTNFAEHMTYYIICPDYLNSKGDNNIMCVHIPLFYLTVGLIMCILGTFFTTFFITGLIVGYFVFNPFYMIILSLGFWGLFATDVVAYLEWRKINYESKKQG